MAGGTSAGRTLDTSAHPLFNAGLWCILYGFRRGGNTWPSENRDRAHKPVKLYFVMQIWWRHGSHECPPHWMSFRWRYGWETGLSLTEKQKSRLKLKTRNAKYCTWFAGNLSEFLWTAWLYRVTLVFVSKPVSYILSYNITLCKFPFTAGLTEAAWDSQQTTLV